MTRSSILYKLFQELLLIYYSTLTSFLANIIFETHFGEKPDYFYWNSLLRGDTKKDP